jgi:hypothetical protein
MKHKVAVLVLAASVVGGVVVGVTADALTSDRPAKAPPAGASSAPPVAADLPDVEVKDPVLVMNDDETATLSATLVNHTRRALMINDAFGGMPQDVEAPSLLGYRGAPRAILQPEEPITIGGTSDSYRFRLRDRATVGSVLPITLNLVKARYSRPAPDTTFSAAVVERSVKHADVANNGPNPAISVRDGVIVKIPGQGKAYVGGWVDSTIDDMTDIRPTAQSSSGRDIEFLHQTATGGPSGVFAQVGTVSLGGPPYLDERTPGDRDYVRTAEVKVGETVLVTIRFPSGDVVAPFRVVQGNTDGTIQAQ